AVGVVMAGTMAASMAACTPGGNGGGGVKKLTPTTDANGNLTWTSQTSLNTAIGYNSATTGIKYDKDNTLSSNVLNYLGISNTSTFTLFGKQYSSSSLKPAWQALSEKLDVKINDTYSGKNTDNQMAEITGSENGFAGYHMFTASAASINSQGAASNLLNIADYLEYMPNYAAFLKAYPNVQLSLTADKNGAMYMLPYFDGNDDIEKYVLLRKDIVETLLDNASVNLEGGITYATQGSNKGLTTTSASIESFMGQTQADNYTIEVTNPAIMTGKSAVGSYQSEVLAQYASEETARDPNALATVTVNYGAALTAAQNSTTALGAAISEAAGKAYTGTSGNIVDLQNFAINETNGTVKGGALLKILREYIKVAYQDKDGGQFYTKLSDVFNSAYAAWDVDLYVALGRCFTTCGDLLNALSTRTTIAREASKLYLLSGRRNISQRLNDVISFAGELYGVRGLESRYQYNYITEDGTLADARNDEATYDALNNMNKLVKEGLLVGWSASDPLGEEDKGTSSNATSGVQTLSLHDYVQTQTAYMIGSDSNPNITGPVLTPVSRWDTDGDGEYDKTMRFTESWRGVKNTGWAISYQAVRNDPNALAACLAFVDYFFSNDGQILMTYGPQSVRGNSTSTTDTDGGFWYGTEANITLEQAIEQELVDTYDGKQYFVTGEATAEYFCYENKLYSGTLYKGKQIPVMTTISVDMFNKLGKNSFTNYARYYIGSALNIGNKDQGFEYQCTANCGIVGANIVNIALVNGTIEHVVQQVPVLGDNLSADQKYSNWKTMTASMLPFETIYSDLINRAPYNIITGFNASSSLFLATNSSNSTNLMIDIVTYGYGNGTIHNVTPAVAMPADAAAIITYLNSLGNTNEGMMDLIEEFMADAWLIAVNAYHAD
ncbi:MAG: hypothetical protein K2N52_03200, partial [Clostridia bacterium]|nr:hypothetical protein [Clostridia bacterium]